MTHYQQPPEPAPPLDPTEPIAEQPETAKKAPTWHKVLGITVLSLLGLCAIGTIASIANSDNGSGSGVPLDRTTTLQAARANCAPGDPDFALGDDGHSLTVTGAGHSSGADIEDVACVLGELGITDSVVSRIDSTRALDGMQEASWGDFAAVWTYHPDDGLNIIIEQK